VNLLTKQFAAIKRAFFFDKLGEDEELKQEFYQPLANIMIKEACRCQLSESKKGTIPKR
jgi:hypothetical protein